MIPAHLCLFWLVCHPSRTFPPKKLEREPQNRLPTSPHRQTTPSLTSDPWPTALVLARYKWVGLSLMRALLLYKSISCLVFMCLPLPVGLFGPATCYSACLTLCGVDESLGFHSLYLVSFLGWVLLGYGPSSLIQPLSPFTFDLWVNWSSHHTITLFLPRYRLVCVCWASSGLAMPVSCTILPLSLRCPVFLLS